MYDIQTIALNVVESTCVVDSYTVVDTPRTPAHNTPCPLPWVRDKAVDMEIPTETCSHDLKKNLIHSIISFVSGFFFGRFGSYANFGLFVMLVSFCCFSLQT